MVFTTNFSNVLTIFKMNQSFNDPFQFRVDQAQSDFEARESQLTASEIENFEAQSAYLIDLMRDNLKAIQSITSQLQNGRGKDFHRQVASMLYHLPQLLKKESIVTVEKLFAEHELPEYLKE